MNKPKAKVFAPNIRDGQSQFEWNYADLPDYIPNSKINIKRGKPAKYSLTSPTTKIEVTRYDTDNDDNFSQVLETTFLPLTSLFLHIKLMHQFFSRWKTSGIVQITILDGSWSITWVFIYPRLKKSCKNDGFTWLRKQAKNTTRNSERNSRNGIGNELMTNCNLWCEKLNLSWWVSSIQKKR